LCRAVPRPWRRLDSGSARAPACLRRRLAVGTGAPSIPTGLGGAPPEVGRRCAGAAPGRAAARPYRKRHSPGRRPRRCWARRSLAPPEVAPAGTQPGPTGLCCVAPRPWRRLDSGSARAHACLRRRLAVGTGAPCNPTGLGGAPPEVGRRCAGAVQAAAPQRGLTESAGKPAHSTRFATDRAPAPRTSVWSAAACCRFPAPGGRHRSG
jgi:hypothetical protein